MGYAIYPGPPLVRESIPLSIAAKGTAPTFAQKEGRVAMQRTAIFMQRTTNPTLRIAVDRPRRRDHHLIEPTRQRITRGKSRIGLPTQRRGPRPALLPAWPRAPGERWPAFAPSRRYTVHLDCCTDGSTTTGQTQGQCRLAASMRAAPLPNLFLVIPRRTLARL
jgi:hypothetical protein